MKPAEEIKLSTRLSTLTGYESVPADRALTVARTLYARSDQLYREASETVPQYMGMTLFAEAADLQAAASWLVERAPPQPDDAVSLVADDVEAFLQANTAGPQQTGPSA